MRLAPETIDGILYGWALEDAIRRNPKRMARKLAYEGHIKYLFEFAKSKGRDWTIAVLCWRNPAYIRPLLESDSDWGLFNRFAHTFPLPQEA